MTTVAGMTLHQSVRLLGREELRAQGHIHPPSASVDHGGFTWRPSRTGQTATNNNAYSHDDFLQARRQGENAARDYLKNHRAEPTHLTQDYYHNR